MKEEHEDISLTKVYATRKKAITGSAHTPFHKDTKILWLPATEMVLELVKQWTKTPAFLAINVPISTELKNGFVVGEDELIQELQTTFNKISDFVIVTAEKTEDEEHIEHGLFLNPNPTSYELTCPFCEKIQTQNLVYLNKVYSCSNCNANIYFDIGYDDHVMTVSDILDIDITKIVNPEAYHNTYLEETKTENIITIIDRETKKTVYVVVIEKGKGFIEQPPYLDEDLVAYFWKNKDT